MSKSKEAGDNNDDLRRRYDYLHNTIAEKLHQQLDGLNSTDTKANILLVGIGALLAGYFQLLASDSFSSYRQYKVLVLLELLCFMMSGFFVFRTFLLRSKPAHKKERWRNDPEPQKLVDAVVNNSGKGEYWLKGAVTKHMVDSYEHNKKLLERKYDNFRLAKMALFVGVLLVFAHILLTLYNVNHIVVNLRGSNDGRDKWHYSATE